MIQNIKQGIKKPKIKYKGFRKNHRVGITTQKNAQTAGQINYQPIAEIQIFVLRPFKILY
ncbi:hypothetical protein SGQ83_06050 [Flavobacterium sp. Fl-318]|uniref:Uncharacterized protein n=1 Tax=Flavobacterium cupriresistens TaxID=2893885 RepID=A0ABU4R8J0_9FLAO|nr:hypothetical protein [Flavobacterium sp. Fl-318]